MTPEGWIRWYFEVKDDLGAPGLDPIKTRGRVYAKRCNQPIRRNGVQVKCHSKVRHSTKRGEWVCGRCGAAWRYVERYQLRGQVQETKRGDGFELASAQWIDIGKLLDEFYHDSCCRWQARLFLANALGSSIRVLASDGIFDYPDAPFEWTRWKINELVRAGRAEWIRRLRTIGVSID